MCKAVLQMYEEVPFKALKPLIPLARSRGKKDIVTLLTGKQENENSQNILLKQRVMQGIADIVDLVPTYVEFEYHSKTEMLIPMLKNSEEFVPFSTLLDKLHMKKVHYDRCAEKCLQKDTCKRIRQTRSIVDRLAKELEKKSPFYEGLTAKIVGSLSEGARVFHVDEFDVHF